MYSEPSNSPIRVDELLKQLLDVAAVFICHGRMAGQHDAVFHDLVAVGEPRRVHAEIASSEHGVARDVAGEDYSRKDAVVFKVDL